MSEPQITQMAINSVDIRKRGVEIINRLIANVPDDHLTALALIELGSDLAIALGMPKSALAAVFEHAWSTVTLHPDLEKRTVMVPLNNSTDRKH